MRTPLVRRSHPSAVKSTRIQAREAADLFTTFGIGPDDTLRVAAYQRRILQ